MADTAEKKEAGFVIHEVTEGRTYRTSDAHYFEWINDARIHQLGVDFKAWYLSVPNVRSDFPGNVLAFDTVITSAPCDTLFGWLVIHREVLETLLAMLPRKEIKNDLPK